MQVFTGSQGLDGAVRGSVVTVGSFDGLHLGHQALIQAVIHRAREVGASAGVYTFDPHPRRLLHPDRAPPLLMSWDQLEEGLAAAGIDFLIREGFTPEFSGLTADAFLKDVIADRVAPQEIYVGRDFHFGKGRGGSGQTLVTLAKDLGMRGVIIPQVAQAGVDVSSTRIRRLIAEGRVEEAADCIGRPYGIRGHVVHGDDRGRTLGFPTANIESENELIPRYGVYATLVEFLDADSEARRSWPSVTNIGTRPTFEAGQVQTEAHLLDFDGDLYGRKVELRFVARIRDERRFEGPDELVAQIERDVVSGRRLLGLSDSERP